MGGNCFNTVPCPKQDRVPTLFTPEGEEERERILGKNPLAEEPPAFCTHPSLDKGRVQDFARLKPKPGRTQPVQQRDSQSTAMKRHRRTLVEDRAIKRLTSNPIAIIPDTRDKDEEENKKTLSVGLYPRVPVHLKVAPCHFRVEKAGNIDDRYQTLSVIGKGGYGEVRKVRNRFTNEIRAVKVITKSKCQMTEKFSDEINILQKLVLYRGVTIP